MEPIDGRAPPSGRAPAKRPSANRPIRVDWHDHLINAREIGREVALNFKVRPVRREYTGLQYKCTTSGFTNGDPEARIRWPRTIGGVVTDGTVVWTAEAIDSTSLRDTILTSEWTFDSGITKSNESAANFVYTAFAAGGIAGQDYEIHHKVTLAGSPGEIEEALIILPVRD